MYRVCRSEGYLDVRFVFFRIKVLELGFLGFRGFGWLLCRGSCGWELAGGSAVVFGFFLFVEKEFGVSIYV